jgi:transcriptional regulator with XRE-family HTH domain
MEERWKRALGQQVRRLRRGLGLTQDKLGQRAGLHMNYISDVERGKRNPSATTLCRLALGLGVKVRDLMVEVDKGLPRELPRAQAKEGAGFVPPEQEVIAALLEALELEEELYRQVRAHGVSKEVERLHHLLRERLERGLRALQALER